MFDYRNLQYFRCLEIYYHGDIYLVRLQAGEAAATGKLIKIN